MNATVASPPPGNRKGAGSRLCLSPLEPLIEVIDLSVGAAAAFCTGLFAIGGLWLPPDSLAPSKACSRVTVSSTKPAMSRKANNRQWHGKKVKKGTA